MERDKIQSEYDDLLALIADLADILAKPERVSQIIKDELDEEIPEAATVGFDDFGEEDQ